MEDYYKDELTGVLSRRYLNLIVSREIERSKRYNERFAVMILDIDDFKLINDTYGHQKGDSALVIFADTLKKTLRASDSIIRYGGDEFVVIMPSVGIKDASKVASRVIKALAESRLGEIQLSASIGIGAYPDNGDTWEEVFRAADRALYEAKRLGKGRYEMVGEGWRGLSLPTKSLIGRRREKSEVARKINEPGKLHLIIGEVGIGKTRLVLETIKSAKAESIYGRCIGTVGGMAYQVIREIIKDGISKYRSRVYSSYESMPEVLQGEIRKIVPGVFREGEKESEGGDKYRLYEAVLYLLSHIKEDTILIVIDDMQWIDEGSMEFISYMLHMIPEKFVIIGIERKEDIEKSPVSDTLRYLGRLKLYDVLELGPLSKAETNMMLQAALGREVEDRMVNIIYEKSGGNPLFIEEILSDLYHSNSMELKDNVYVLREGVKITPPLNVKDVIKDKIDSFNEDEQRVLEFSAILERRVDPFLLAKSSGADEGEVFDALDKAVRLHLMNEAEDGSYIFNEGIVRDTIIEGISRGKRRYYHRKVAEVLEKMYSGNIEGIVEEIIYHFDEAGLREKANKYCRIAGDKFYGIYDYERAIGYYARIIDTLATEEDAKDIIRKFYIAHWHTGKYENFVPIAEKLLSMFPDLAGEIYVQIGNLYNEAGKVESALEVLNRGLDSIKNTVESLGLKKQVAWALAFKGDIQKARSMVKEIISFWEEELRNEKVINKEDDDKYSDLTDAYNTLAVIYKLEGDREKAIEYYQRALEWAEKEKNIDYQDIAIFHINIALAYLELQNTDGVLEHLKIAKYNIEKAPSLYLRVGIDQILGETKLKIGELETAEDLLKSSLKRYRAMQDYIRIVEVSLGLSDLYTIKRKFSLGLKTLLEVKDIAYEVGNKEYPLSTLFNIFRIHLLSGEIEKCKEDIEEMKKISEEDERYIQYLLEAEAMFSNEVGRYEQAVTLYKKLIEKEPNDIPYLIGLAKGYAGNGDTEKAKEVLRNAENLIGNRKVEFERMQNEFYIGEVYFMVGEVDKAITIFKNLYPEFEKRGAHLYTYKIDSYIYPS